jgi:hypothetical protein
MKILLVLWDPENPIVPAAPVVQALIAGGEADVRALTFDELGHPTLPNGAFQLRPLLGREEPDGILWIEGGPLPADLKQFRCPKACWLLNTHLEPTLLDDVGPLFDRVFSASLRDTAEEKARWLPGAAGEGSPFAAPAGVSLLLDDPKPPQHLEAEQILVAAARDFGPTSTPVVMCLGNGGQVHPMLFEGLRSGAALVADPGSDLRGIAHVGEHLEVYPSKDALTGFVRDLLKDPDRLARLAARGPAIIDHLHQPSMRATQICQGLWPHHRILSGKDYKPRMSILVTCYRYLQRFRVCLESLVRQDLPPGSLEIVVADPGSPDGLFAYLEDFALKHPQLRVVHLPLDSRYRRNRGVGINRAFDVSSGRVMISIDADIVFPPHLIGELADHVEKSPREVFGVSRVFLPKDLTERILAGALDPFVEFTALSRSTGDGEGHPHIGVLGYCQAVHRSAFARARYPEEFDQVNQSDIVFVERLTRWSGVRPRFLEEQKVLHLWHPRNWMGTNDLL